MTVGRDFASYTSCKACGNTTKTEHGECATCGAPKSAPPAPETEIDRLRAEREGKMKRDIIFRLRMNPGYAGTVDDAIAEITRLRAERNELRGALEALMRAETNQQFAAAGQKARALAGRKE